MKTMTLLLLAGAAAAAGDTRADAERKLEATLSLDLQGVKLGEAVQVFRDVTGLNFVVENGTEVIVRLAVRDVTAKSALRLLLQPAGLGAAFEHGAVVIRNREALAGTMTTRIYDVRSAMRKIQDFPGAEPGFERARICICCMVHEDGVVACSFGDILVMLVRENTADRSWDAHPRASILLANGFLHVTQTPRVHREIENLLRQLCF